MPRLPYRSRRTTSVRIRSIARTPLIAVIVVSSLTMTAVRAEAAACKKPWQLAEEINAVITDGQPLDACNWRGQLDDWKADESRWEFECWEVNCSQNLPLLAAAVAVGRTAGRTRRAHQLSHLALCQGCGAVFHSLAKALPGDPVRHVAVPLVACPCPQQHPAAVPSGPGATEPVVPSDAIERSTTTSTS